MNLKPGMRLRQYQILEAIGAGGMGEVYRARDTNLERDVAVKILPRTLADNPLNLARLEREARAIAALSHPNILAVYDFGSEDEVAFLVTELLEGETLRERLADGAMAPRKATEIGRQIARGLAAAHDKSIVHRDLKPENIFLTRDARVKILDFGLATAGEMPGPDQFAADKDLATMTNLTAPGTVLGTVNYMSPEQVKGQPTDNRSDLFSFGSVLYEMVSGTRPFQRETHAETMTAILKEEPPELASLVPDVPPALAAIIRRCMEKRAGERFHSAHDLAFSLEALSGSSVSTGAAAALAGVPVARRRPGAAWTAAIFLVGLVLGTAATYLLRPAPEPPQTPSFTLRSSRQGTVTNARFVGNEGDAIYSATWEGGPVRVYPSSAGSRTAEPLNLEKADLLGVSSTGELALSLNRRYPMGFEAIGTLAVAQPGGAAPRQVLEDVLVADWSPDGRTLAVAHEVAGVVRLEYPIGTVLYKSGGWISSLRIHPDGNRIVFADCPERGDNMSEIKIVDRGGSVETVHIGGQWGVVWSPDGRYIWSSNGHGVYRSRSGGEHRLVRDMTGSVSMFDMDAHGRMLISTGMIRRELIARVPGGTGEANLGWLDWPTPRTLSDDGRLVLFEEGNDFSPDGYAIYLRETAGAPPLLLGFGSVLALSPDNKQVAVVKGLFGDETELVIMPTGPGEARKVDTGGLRMQFGVGKWLNTPAMDDPGDLFMVCREGEGVPRLYCVALGEKASIRAVTPADMPLASQGHILSPDGRSLIVQPADGPAVSFDIDGTGPRTVKGIEPGDLPLRFDRDGRHIFVQAGGNIPAPILRVDPDTGERAPWLELAPRDGAGVFQVDHVNLSQDGAAYIYSFRRIISSLGVMDGLE